MKDYEIHPAALLFPMMSDEELKDLSNDIAQNGLLEPIAMCEGKVLDGRNRLKACQLAGVEPSFKNGDVADPYTFVLSKNLRRRHL